MLMMMYGGCVIYVKSDKLCGRAALHAKFSGATQVAWHQKTLKGLLMKQVDRWELAILPMFLQLNSGQPSLLKRT